VLSKATTGAWLLSASSTSSATTNSFIQLI
jgi:hypothetical protein